MTTIRSASPASATGARTSPATSRRSPGCELAWCCDADPAALRARRRARFPRARRTADLDDLLADADARRGRARHAGADPRRARRARAARPASTASSRSRSPSPSRTPSAPSPRPRETGRMLMVGHLLEYHPGVAKLKEIADSGELGDIHYIYSQPPQPRASCAPTRTRSGRSARTTSRSCCTSPARSRYEVERARRVLHARGRRGRRLRLPALPVRARRPPAPVVAGPAQGAPLHGRRLAADGDVRRHGPRAQGDGLRQGLRRGRRAPTASTSPARATSGARAIANREPLRLECEHFVECVREGRTPRSDGARGLRVVRVLEGAAGVARRDRAGSSVQPSDLRARASCSATACELGEGVALRRARRHPPRHRGRRRLRDPGRRGARQAAEARARTRPRSRERAARRSCSARARSCARGAVVFAGARIGDGRDRRRPGATCASARASARAR